MGTSEFSGLLALPGESRYYIERPKLFRENRFKVDVTHDRTLVWRSAEKNELVPPSRLADRIVQIFLDLLSRANQGKVEPPHM